MKKIVKLLISGLCVLSLLSSYACGKDNDNKEESGAESSAGESSLPSSQETGIFAGNYKEVELSQIVSLAVTISGDIEEEILLNNKAVVSEFKGEHNYIDSEGVQQSATRKEELKISREGLETSSSYMAQWGSSRSDEYYNSDSTYFYDGSYMYYGSSHTKDKRDMNYDEFLELLLHTEGGVSVGVGSIANIIEFIEVGTGSPTNINKDIVWSIDDTDELYTKVKVYFKDYTCFYHGTQSNVMAEWAGTTYIWVYNKSNKCIASSGKEKRKATRFYIHEGRTEIEEYTEYVGYAKPWEGTVTLPSDLNTYVERTL